MTSAPAHTYMAPTDEQLARFVCVRVLGPGHSDYATDVLSFFSIAPGVKQAWLDEHRRFQELAWALDEEAAAE